MASLPIMQSAPGPRTVIDGKEYLYFAGTGYLGIGARAELGEAACEAMKRLGMGTATTRAGFGNNDVTLGVGQLDIAAIIHEARRIGVKYYFIEDESDTSEKQIPDSLRYLHDLK